MEGFVLIIGVLLIAGIVYVLDRQAREKRRKELALWASARGMEFDSDKDPGVAARFGSFRALQQGSNRYAYNVMTGSWGERGFVGFDYHYETYTQSKHGRQTHHHYFSAIVLFSSVPLKPLFIRAEGVFDKITEFFGYDDIDFESAEFSRRFFVQSPDRKWAYDVIHARTMQLLLDAPQFTIEFAPHAVMACRKTRFIIPEFEAAAALVEGVLDGLPGYVVKERKEISDNAPPLPAIYPQREI